MRQKRLNVIRVFIVSSSILVCAASVVAAQRRAKPWHLIWGRFGSSVVSDGKALYVIGGGDADSALGGIEKIDLNTGISEELAARIVSRRFHSAVIVSQTIYVLGGESDEGLLSSVDAVGLQSKKVRTITRLPTPRRGLNAAAVEDLIFTIGGSAEGERSDDARTAVVEVYDLGNEKWLRAPPMPEPKEVPVVLHDRYLYALGGYAGGATAVTSCYRYDLSAGKWEKLAPTPFTLSGYSAVNIGRAIVCFGDYKNLGRVVAFVPETGAWKVLDVAFTPRRNSSACRVGDMVYVVGGNGERLALSLIERFSIADLETALKRAGG